MRTVVILLFLVALTAAAQEKSQVTVKNVEKNNGVVLITLSEKGKTLDLQCNEGASSCTAVKTGDYQMVRLPKNRGLYDCQNVELFKAEGEVSQDERIGQYCLVN